MTEQREIDIGRVQSIRRLLLALLIAAAFLVLAFVRPDHSQMGGALAVRLAGIVLIAAGILGRMWCTLYIGGRKSKALVDEGPYSVTRNPLYVFSTVAASGAGAQTGSIVIAILFGIGCWMAFHLVILKEEAHLSQVLDAEYQDYLTRVPRFLPRLSLFRDAEALDVIPGRVYATLIDGMVFYAAVPFCLGIAWLQEAGILPVIMRLP